MPHALRPRQKAAHSPSSAQSSQHTQPAVPGPSSSKPDESIPAAAGLTMADRQRATSQAWLLKPTTVSRATHRAFVAENQGDQFLTLAKALRDRGEEMQESMLTKFYLFLRDVLPEGLTGDLAHIRGDDVMRCLLNSTELVPSRHKFTRQAETAFSKLDAWMSKSSNWREAKAKHTRESSHGGGEKPGRKKHKALAPGLYSPEGMLAILIIGHPDDDKFKNWIVRRLQIHWMLYDRDTLDVKEGFWKGLDASNLADIFTPEDERTADRHLLADYTQLFGECFVRAQEDIQPYLQAWAKDVVSSSHDIPSDSDALSELEPAEPATRKSSLAATDPNPTASRTPAKVPVFPARDTVKLRRALFPTNPAPRAVLQQWLASKLAAEAPGDPVVRWCRYWEGRLNRAHSYYEQSIVQSLFLQSVCRLYNMRSTSLASVESVVATQQPDGQHSVSLENLYSVLDIHDGRPKAPVGELMTETVAFLRTHPVYKAVEEANARLLQEVESDDAVVDSKAVSDLLQKVFQEQTSSLRYISSSTHYSDTFYGVMAMDVVRTQVLLFSAEEPVPDDPLFWRDHKGLLTNPDVISTLKLTNWQLRALFMPSPDYQQVLTPAQDSVFRKLRTGAQGAEIAKLDELQPMPITHGISSDSILSGDFKDMLGKLFGDIEKPHSAPPTPTSLAAVPCRTEERPQPIPSPQSTHEKAPAQAQISKTTPAPSAKTSLAESVTSPAPTCVSTPARNTSVPPITPNAYAGKVYLPAKRPASPADVNPRQTKTPRPGIRGDLDSMQQELSGEVQASKEELRTEVQRLSESLRQDVQASAEQLKHDLRQDAQASAEQMKDDLRRDVRASTELLKEDLRQDVQASAEQFKVDLRQEAQASTETLKSDLEATKRELESQLRTLQMGFTTDAGRLQQSLDAISAEVRGVTDTLAKPPQPTGLLVQDCPAPAGQDQKDYESRLFRACFTYVYNLWDPEVEGGVGEDSGTLDDIKAKFPDLEETAIITALERFHALVFNQPVKRG